MENCRPCHLPNTQFVHTVTLSTIIRNRKLPEFGEGTIQSCITLGLNINDY